MSVVQCGGAVLCGDVVCYMVCYMVCCSVVRCGIVLHWNTQGLTLNSINVCNIHMCIY